MVRTAFASSRRRVLLTVLAALVATASSARAQTTALFVHSQPGDYVGQGLDYNYTSAQATFQPSRNIRNGVTIRVQGASISDYWFLDFVAAGGVPLTSGAYESTEYPWSTSGNGLEVSGLHRACTQPRGRFVVREILFGEGGVVTKFAADFEQLCGNGDAGLFGAVRYNSTITTVLPFDGAYPTYQLTIAPAAHGRVTAEGLDCGSGATTCFISLPAPADRVLTAVPDGGYEFIGWSGSCSGNAVTTLRINQVKTCSALFEPGFQGTTALALDSEPGDYMGQGIDRSYSAADGTFLITPNYRKGLTITLTPPFTYSPLWRLEFAAAGDVPLTVGTYDGARYYSTRPYNGLGAFASGRGCSGITGRFVVHEIVYKTDGSVRRFAADFEQHCEDGAAGLFGAIRYNATNGELSPFGGQYPVYRLDVSTEGGGRVTGGGIDCRAAGPVCQVSLPAATHVALTGVPDPGYVFAGWGGGCRGGAATTVHVNGPKTCAVLFEPIVSTSPRTVLFVDSQVGDPVGRGSQTVFNLDNGQWAATSGSSGRWIVIEVDDGIDRWRVDFSAPSGQPLAVGTYGDASRYPFTQFNGLNVSGLGTTCNRLTGRFIVLDIALAPDGTVQRFAADFEQHCEDAVPALFGAIRYNSAVGPVVPFDGAYPTYQLVVTPPQGGTVLGGGLDCGAAGPVCQASLTAAARITLTAAPDPGYVFAGWSGSCRGGVETSVHVNGPKTCAVLFEPLVSVSPRSVLYLESQAGDYIGGGANAVFNPANSKWTATSGSGGNRITIAVEDALDRWRVEFSAPEGQPLVVGDYNDAHRYPLTPLNGLNVSGPGRGCNSLTGRFVILDIAVAPDGKVQRFAADFEQHCDDAVPALFGAIRYNSTVEGLMPFGGAYPSYQLTVIPPQDGRVTGAGLDCGPTGPVCQLPLPGAATVTLTAVPEAGYLFAGWSGSCRGGAETSVRVNGPKTCSALFHPLASALPRTVLYMDSQPGDYIGAGAKRIFNLANGAWAAHSADNGSRITITVEDAVDQWNLDFSAPKGQPLAVGEYYAARAHGFASFNGLDVSGAGRGCSELTGRFVILDIALASDGTVHRFAADFEQHCSDAVPALFGSVRYNAALGNLPAFGGAYPSYRLSIAAPSGGRVTSANLACGGGSTQCLLTLPAAAQVTVTATPDPGFVFMGWADDCSGGTTTTVHVNGAKRCTALFEFPNPTNPSTVLRWTSQPGHFIGQGRNENFSIGNSKWTATVRQDGGGVEFYVTSVGPRGPVYWTLRMSAPSGERLQAGRRYTGASGVSSAGTPGLDLFGNGRYCGGGEFTVDQASFGPQNTLLRFSATFVLHCGNVAGPLLTGALQYSPAPPTLTLDPSALWFAALHNGSSITAPPSAQVVRLSLSKPNVGWVVTPSAPWITVSPSSGMGAAPVTVSLNLAGMPPTTGDRTGWFNVELTDGSGDAATTAVSLALLQAGATSPPLGNVDTPLDNITGVTGAIPFTGWALDDVEVTGVTICRAAVAGEVAPVDANCGGAAEIFVGRAEFVEGARPDVQAAYPAHPRNDAAGWGLMVLTNMLPNQGNGTFVFSVYARDREGNVVRLGTRTMTCDNANATAPFGTLDTPGQGQTVGGSSYANFGWALTQQPKFIPVDGSTLTVYVDGQPVGSPSYNHFRADIAAAFPGLANSDGAVGISTIDTTKLSNGLHTIAWSATDSAGVTSGLGSRYFRVLNGVSTSVLAAATASSPATLVDEIQALTVETSTLAGRRSWDPAMPWQTYGAGHSARIVVRGEEVDRFELALGERPGETYAGYMRVGDGLRPLPVGSRLDAETGAFTWSPGVGFIGSYDLVFTRSTGAGAIARREVRFILQPKGSGHIGAQVVIDTPRPQDEFDGSFAVGGWAADLDAPSGTGIDAVHVWAYPLTGGPPVFLGVAAYGGARPDVSAIHGDQFRRSGYDLLVQGLPSGPYDLAVFAWSNVSGGFVPAQVVRVTVR